MWCASAHGLVYDFHQARQHCMLLYRVVSPPGLGQVGGLHTSGRRGSPASCQLCFSLCVWCWRGCAALHVQRAGVCPNPESPRAGQGAFPPAYFFLAESVVWHGPAQAAGSSAAPGQGCGAAMACSRAPALQSRSTHPPTCAVLVLQSLQGHIAGLQQLQASVACGLRCALRCRVGCWDVYVIAAANQQPDGQVYPHA